MLLWTQGKREIRTRASSKIYWVHDELPVYCITIEETLSKPRWLSSSHTHVRLDRGRARAAQIYPPGLCKAVCKGLIEQFEVDRKGQYLPTNIEYKEECSSKGLMEVANQLKKKYRTVEEEDDWAEDVAWDDVSGATLDPKEVRRAREEEIQYVRTMKFYDKVPIEQCYAKIGRAPISTRWIDINKGDQSNPNYRSRLVAREINTHRRDVHGGHFQSRGSRDDQRH